MMIMAGTRENTIQDGKPANNYYKIKFLYFIFLNKSGIMESFLVNRYQSFKYAFKSSMALLTLENAIAERQS
jgi:hypothetical protein